MLDPSDVGPLRAVVNGFTEPDSVEANDHMVREVQGLDAAEGSEPWYIQRMFYGRAVRANVLFDSVPYLVPSFDADLIFKSTPPDPELVDQVRLPFDRVLVLFTHPLRFGPESGWLVVNEEIRDFDRGAMEGMGIDAPDDEADYRGWPTKGGALVGMLLTDDGDGVSDWVGWLIATAADDGGLEEPVIEFGRRSLASFGPIGGHVACLVSWGQWSPPPEPRFADIEPGSKEERKLVRTGKFARAARSGSVDGVHVLHLKTKWTVISNDEDGEDDSEATGRTVRPHLRRGHWRSVRVGPRDNFRYEPRWIAPTIVGGDHIDPDDRRNETVYHLPEPVSDDSAA